MKKKERKTLKDIHKLHQNLMGLLHRNPGNPSGNYKVSIKVTGAFYAFYTVTLIK
ncbi:hypothetical protein QSE00_23330 [Arenibacter sp. M-2]|uniref:hypothetical protein n=1 Tax=Arenibacter sp. M-2 TaxID=3053612 RepID=UPI002570CBB8|nr:hypothetical protein [Arenibacter sp. M-2]MDL5514762.1 hypothetical protein [Arenibacter sp. M-2]